MARRVSLDGGADDRLRECGVHGVCAHSDIYETLRDIPCAALDICLSSLEHLLFSQVFVVLLSRVILYFDLNLYQPLSKVDENM